MGAPVVSYGVSTLRAAADEHAAAAAAAVAVREALSGHGVEAAMLGAVPAAAGFHAALMHVLVRQAADAGAEAVRRTDLTGRATRTAGLGAGLVGATTATARAAAPGAA